MKRELRRVLAYIILAFSFGGTLLLASVLRSRRDRRDSTGQILVTGTFYNRGWFTSHIEPLARCGARAVLVVTDASQPAPDRVTMIFPSRRMIKCLGRAAAKL